MGIITDYISKRKMIELETMKLENMRRYGFGPETMKNQKVCKCCGCVCNRSDESCSACKAPLPSDTLYDLYKSFHISCPSCDTVVSKSFAFCPICGKRLKNEHSNACIRQ